MPRSPRCCPAGYWYHVFNRSARKLALFESINEYDAFLELLAEAQLQVPVSIACYCVMPNHWHLVVQPAADGDLSRYIKWLCTTHAARWRRRRETVGEGAVYQSRFKAIPVQCDRHFLTLCRYVERNPVRAGLVPFAGLWPWSSASSTSNERPRPLLSPWPTPRPLNWEELLDRRDDAMAAALRQAVAQALPWGDPSWQEETTLALGGKWPRPAVGRPGHRRWVAAADRQSATEVDDRETAGVGRGEIGYDPISR